MKKLFDQKFANEYPGFWSRNKILHMTGRAYLGYAEMAHPSAAKMDYKDAHHESFLLTFYHELPVADPPELEQMVRH